jgi:polyhydroxyalkanoate synthesis regulator protein
MAAIDAPVTIKRYAGQRLHNPGAGGYAGLENVAGVVEDEDDFVVYHAKTGEDITRSVLNQIILVRARHG